jgi:hypothetical protein
MSSSGPQANYFPSFQMSSIIRHTDSSAKFVCALQQASSCHEAQRYGTSQES